MKLPCGYSWGGSSGGAGSGCSGSCGGVSTGYLPSRLVGLEGSPPGWPQTDVPSQVPNGTLRRRPGCASERIAWRRSIRTSRTRASLYLSSECLAAWLLPRAISSSVYQG